MSKVWLEVAEDKSRPEGGHAVIRLHGVAGLAAQPSFSILPLDGETPGVGAIADEHAPVTTRETSDGTELIVGPEVVDHPALLPGTPVAIEVRAVGVRAEVLWPSIAPLARQRKQPVIMTTARRLSLVQASRDQIKSAAPRPQLVETLGLAPILAATAAAQAAGLGVVAPLATVEPTAPREMPPPIPVLAREEPPPVAEVIAAVTRAEAAAMAATPVAELRGEAGPSPRAEPLLIRAEAGPRPAMANDAGRRPPPPPPSIQTAPYYPIQKVEPAPTDRIGRRLSGIAMMMALLAIGSSLMVLQVVRGMRSGPQLALMTPVGPGGEVQVTVPPSTMFDIFSVGTLSPGGRSTGGIDAARALALADTHIHSAGSPADLKEGEFWIKRALSQTLADDRTRWALTQLGSLYAAPADGDPNYERARLVWEMSAALGDPVAMCFLGSLHQYGLGVPASRANALRWYELARQTGGCKGLDELIAKLKR